MRQLACFLACTWGFSQLGCGADPQQPPVDTRGPTTVPAEPNPDQAAETAAVNDPAQPSGGAPDVDGSEAGASNTPVGDEPVGDEPVGDEPVGDEPVGAVFDLSNPDNALDVPSAGAAANVCSPASEDFDGDGFTVADGDCNDCDGNANPGALDVPGNEVDEDCNGTADDLLEDCEAAITDLADPDPYAAAAAMNLCQRTTADAKSWGILDARYTLADGSETGVPSLTHGLLEDLGPNVPPRLGSRLLALSSGTARDPDDPGWAQPLESMVHGTQVDPPAGFPLPAPACPGVTWDPLANDSVALELTLRVPTNAQSFAFDLNFYTSEFPVFICTEFNDAFVVLQEPPPPNAQQGNISFDAEGNPISVNNGLLRVCDAQETIGEVPRYFECELGSEALQDTGFYVPSGPLPDFGFGEPPEAEMAEPDAGVGAATGWLQTQSPVEPGQIVTLRFMLWDTGDHVLDSTVLLDNFRFEAEAATDAVTKPVLR